MWPIVTSMLVGPVGEDAEPVPLRVSEDYAGRVALSDVDGSGTQGK